ncbi:SPFH domain-containing protein [Pelagicoccus sp. SDUM812003]|uniref:SPFH domain-containing protein n=1 Tax=Pelagicoccus sp. SDUM812003 TaxID=3041267 RepID=UPI0028103B50|nr:SPFH domain-containing protein [Pelagicoccus sp. SDUM812003]MDQ8204765.1 SPFH domain-containing protein [Pelagicoccus sp. SDUM812003]
MTPLLFVVGLLLYGLIRCILSGFYTVKPNERAVITSFGRARRLKGDPQANGLSEEEAVRYNFPEVEVIKPGGPYFRWPWQKVYKVNISTQSMDITWDPSKDQPTIEAVTKDNLTTGVRGQIRYRVSENHLYAYLFGVESPLEHVMGYFVSILRERISNFVDPKSPSLLKMEVGGEELGNSVPEEAQEGVSINDLRKNLPLINKYMEEQCQTTAARYGIELDAALITEIDPPEEVDRALAAINSTRNQVAADISTAQADADQQITLSKRAVEIATNNAEAEVAPLKQLSETLSKIKQEGGSSGLEVYLRNMRVPLLGQAKKMYRSN